MTFVDTRHCSECGKYQLNSKFNNHQHPIMYLPNCLLARIQLMTILRFSPAPATLTRSTSL